MLAPITQFTDPKFPRIVALHGGRIYAGLGGQDPQNTAKNFVWKYRDQVTGETKEIKYRDSNGNPFLQLNNAGVPVLEGPTDNNGKDEGKTIIQPILSQIPGGPPLSQTSIAGYKRNSDSSKVGELCFQINYANQTVVSAHQIAWTPGVAAPKFQEIWYQPLDGEGDLAGPGYAVLTTKDGVIMGAAPDENFIRVSFDITQNELCIYSVEEMKKLTSLKVGDRVRTRFFNVSVICLWEIKSAADVEDWRFSVDIDNGLKATLAPENFVVNVDQFGAYRNDLTKNSGPAFNAAYLQAFVDPQIDTIEHGKSYRSDEQIDPFNGQSTLDPSVTNYDLPFSLDFKNTLIEFHGQGDVVDYANPTDDQIAENDQKNTGYYMNHREVQKSVRNALFTGKLLVINKGQWDYGIRAIGLNWGEFGGLSGEGFLETSVSIESNGGKGGLWNVFKFIKGKGGQVPVVVDEVANANTFGSIWAGYGLKGSFECYAGRTQIGRLSIENNITGKEQTLQHCARFFASANIDTFECEMGGVDGAEIYKAALISDGAFTTVNVSNPTFVASGDRFLEINDGKLFVIPKEGAYRAEAYSEIYTTAPCRADKLFLRRANQENKTEIVSAPSYSAYETVTIRNEFNWSVNMEKITLDNSSATATTDFQIRAVDYSLNDGPSLVKNVAAGEQYTLTADELLKILMPGQIVSYKCRARNANSETVNVITIEKDI